MKLPWLLPIIFLQHNCIFNYERLRIIANQQNSEAGIRLLMGAAQAGNILSFKIRALFAAARVIPRLIWALVAIR